MYYATINGIEYIWNESLKRWQPVGTSGHTSG